MNYRSLARLKALRAEVATLRRSLGVEPVPMADGTTRDVNLYRVYCESLAAIRAGEHSPWFDLARDADLDALAAEGDTGGRLFLLAVIRGMAWDGDKRRVIEDLSEPATASVANDPPAPLDAAHDATYDPDAPRMEDYRRSSWCSDSAT